MSNLKNVEGFNKLISLYTGYGGTQVPGSPNLRVESLSELLTQAREALLQVSVTKTGYESATNWREVTFVQTKLLASRILSELKSCGALPQTVADAAGMVRKIRGRVLTDKPETPAAVTDSGKPVVKRPRVTGSGYDSVIYHFEKLIETLAAEPKYAPGLPELQVPALKQTLQHLRAAQEAVANSYSRLSLARIHRDTVLYGEWGVHHTAMAIKQQVRARFGFTSLQAVEVGRIEINPIKLG
ncbi:MAG: hypothetical protein JNJ65_02925 [Cyclobacteriaceae bacterium]|nr:hypothetical protein [Cyclobacteriaceae bacterium]